MKRFLPLFMILAACASQPRGGQPVGPVKIGEYTSDVGSNPVGVIPTATLHDATRNKDVPISIDYPARGGPFPVIVFSPGYGGSNLSYEALVSYWAGNGYVVIRPAHADAGALHDPMRDAIREAYPQRPENERGRRRAVPQNQQAEKPQPFRPNPMETIWDKEREGQWSDRVADVKVVLDNLDDLPVRFPELRDKIDASKIGVGGHSYGAFTALLIGGVETFGNPPLSLADSRVKAVLAMSPPGVAPNRDLTRQSFATLRVPAMFMTGSEDRGATEAEDADWRKQAFEFSPAGDKYFVLFQGARHMSFTGLSSATYDVVNTVPTAYPGTYNPNVPETTQSGGGTASRRFISDRTIFQRIKVVSLLFWDAYLKADGTAKQLMEQDKMPSGVMIEKK